MRAPTATAKPAFILSDAFGMRVLYLADPFLPIPPVHYGGIERIAASVIRGAQASGHEVALAAHADSRVEGARLYPLRAGALSGRLALAENIWRVAAAVRDFEPDLIHSFARLAYLAPLLGSGMPKIMAFHRHPTPRTVRWAAQLGGESLTFTGCSEFIMRAGATSGGRWVAVPNGIELGRYTYVPEVPPDAPLVFLSRVERVKGAHEAIAAARAAGRRLILAGNRAWTGPEAAYWEREIAPHLDGDRVSYLGSVDDAQKNALLGRAAALLVPIAWEEPFGMVFAEALACGTPVISMRRGALPEIVIDGQHGFLCATTAELPGAIASIPRISRAACRAKACAELGDDQMTWRHEILYKTLDRGQGAHAQARA